MKRYKVSFVGRTIGSQGVVYLIQDVFIAKSVDALEEQLYKKYEHIKNLKVEREVSSYMVYRVYQKSDRRTILRTGLSESEARRVVMQFKTTKFTMVSYTKEQ
jgi:hypothetical protein